MQAQTSLVERFAAYALSEQQKETSGHVSHHARRAVIDWFAALFAGNGMSPGVELARAHKSEFGVSRCSLPLFRATTIPSTAAWINGSVSHSAEVDDIYRDAVYHPGCPTIAAALAAAELVGASGGDFLRAIIIGYEISTRVGAAIQPSHYRYFHTTGTVGCLGAAAAASVLIAPRNASAVANALATATTFASGLQQAFRSDAMTKPLHAGHAAAMGIYAAQSAAHGVTGAHDILEGPFGFGAAMADRPNWTLAATGLGIEYNITRVTQKLHACCGHTFAAIDAGISLREQLFSDIEGVQSIEIETYKAAIDIAGNPDPATPFEAKFSLPYTVCHALLTGSVGLPAFAPDRLADPRIRALMNRVVLRADPDLTRSFPGVRAARVRVRTRSGAVLEHFSPYRKGDPEAPLTDTELERKYCDLTDPVLGKGRSRSLLEKLWKLDIISVRDLDLV